MEEAGECNYPALKSFRVHVISPTLHCAGLSITQKIPFGPTAH